MSRRVAPPPRPSPCVFTAFGVSVLISPQFAMSLSTSLPQGLTKDNAIVMHRAKIPYLVLISYDS